MTQSRKIREGKKPGVKDRTLEQRLQALQDFYGLKQSGLAKKIGAHPPQLSAWIAGAEKPSAKMLVAMGNIASNLEDRLWFWHQAGIDKQRLLDDLRGETGSELNIPEGTLDFAAPVVERVAITAAGDLQMERKGDLRVPSILSRDPGSVFSMRVPRNLGFPQSFVEGDFAVVERLSGSVLPEGALVAVFFEQTPHGYELSDEAALRRQLAPTPRLFTEQDEMILRLNDKLNPHLAVQSERENEARWQKILQDFDNPTVLFGRLTLQIAGGAGQLNSNWKEWLTRVALSLSFSSTGGARIPLCDWEKGIDLIESESRLSERIRPPAWLVGEVVGWFRNRAASGNAMSFSRGSMTKKRREAPRKANGT